MVFGIVALAVLIRLPLSEGRAENLGLFSIYTDPFILYGYTAAIPFFIALYKTIRLFGYIGQTKAFSLQSVKAIDSIKVCAIVFSVFIGIGGVYIRIFHDKADDPAGFLAICIAAIFLSLVVAAVMVVFGRILQNGIDLQAGKALI